jgi:hypothetical protein
MTSASAESPATEPALMFRAFLADFAQRLMPDLLNPIVKKTEGMV